MAAYRRVYDSRNLQAGCREPGSAAEPYTLGNRVWATFTFTFYPLRPKQYTVYPLHTHKTRYERYTTSRGVLSAADMVVQRRDGPRRLRDHDDDDDNDTARKHLLS